MFPVPDTKSKVYTPSPHVCERKANYSLTSQNPVYTEHSFCVVRKLSSACLDTELSTRSTTNIVPATWV